MAPQLRGQILVVDDEPDIRALIHDVLTDEGYKVHLCATGEEALQALGKNTFDLILADIKMPGMSGMELLVEARAMVADIQVVLMTAYASATSVRQAWRDEAFDYLFKPLGLDELRACVDAAIRNKPAVAPWQFLDLKVDRQARQVWIGEREISLSPLEYNTLVFLFENRGRVVSNHDLLRAVWQHTDPHKAKTGTIKAIMARIRSKLGDNAQAPRYIFNEWGVGYRLGQR